MARRCGCAGDSCSCIVVAGDGIDIVGTGSERNPYVITSEAASIETGFAVQYNNSDVVLDVHRLDFRGSAVSVVPGADEAVVTITVPDPVSGATIPAGVIWMYGNTTPPAGWLMCNGATLLIATYPALFGAISNRYGGDGVTNFMLPLFADRMPVGTSATKPLTTAGHLGGSATKSIGVANLPPHAHTINHDHPANSTSYNSAFPSSEPGPWMTESGNFNVSGTNGNASTAGNDGQHAHTVNIPSYSGNSGSGTGSAAAFDVMPPWLAVGFIIKAS